MIPKGKVQTSLLIDRKLRKAVLKLVKKPAMTYNSICVKAIAEYISKAGEK